MRNVVVFVVIGALVAGAIGCSTWSRTKTGTAVGAGAGAGIGAIIGNRAGNTALGAIIGAAVGGAAGAYIGHYMDKQAEEMQRDLEGATIKREGEGILITFASGILFDVDKSTLRPEVQANLDKLANILQKYPDTNIMIAGHTDATGSEEHNMTLSQNRAQSVGDYVASRGVSSSRFSLRGFGESQPVASNDTDEGRQQNRRVELAIWANDKLKKAAEQQAAGG